MVAAMNRKEWLYAMMALLGGIVGGALGNHLWSAASAVAAEAPAHSIAAERILLVDSRGKTRAALFVDDKSHQPNFELYDDGEKKRFRIGLGDRGGAALGFLDPKGTVRIALTLSSEDILALRMFDSKAQLRTLFGVDSGGEPALDFYTAEGRLLRELP
jgi:hypothetical protein